MVGLGSGAENHTLLLNLGISLTLNSAVSFSSMFVTSSKYNLDFLPAKNSIES